MNSMTIAVDVAKLREVLGDGLPLGQDG